MAFLGGIRRTGRPAAPWAAGIFAFALIGALLLLFLSKDPALPSPADDASDVAAAGPGAGLYGDLQGPAGDRAVGGEEWARNAGRKFSVFERLAWLWRAAGDNQKLRADLKFSAREVERWRSIANSQAARIARYEALLRLKEKSGEEGFPAEVVLVSGGRFNRTLLANAGADAGLRRGDVAVTERGLAGRVVAVGRRSLRILALTDPQSRTPVISTDRRVQAVLVGDQSARPRLEFVTDPDALIDGQAWETSGLGGLFPRNLPVGVAHRDPGGQWRLTLAIDPGAAEFVRIVRAQPIPVPENKDEYAAQANLFRPFEDQAATPPVATPIIAPKPVARPAATARPAARDPAAPAATTPPANPPTPANDQPPGPAAPPGPHP